MTQHLVSDSDINLRYDGIIAPWLKTNKDPVFQSHHSKRIGAGGRIEIEIVMVELPSEIIRNIVCVVLFFMSYSPCSPANFFIADSSFVLVCVLMSVCIRDVG